MSSHLPTYNAHTLRVLEFEAVREIVASFADSAEGRARIRELEPARDAVRARALLAEAGECLDAVRFDEPLPAIPAPDIRDLFPRLGIQGAVLEIEEITNVAASLEIVTNCAAYFKTRKEKYSRLASLAAELEPQDELVRVIRRAITPDGEISDEASPELRSIRRRLNRARSGLREMIEKKLNGLSDTIVSERTITIRDGRFVIPVRENMKRQVPGAVHDHSQTGRTLFIEPLEAIEGNNEIRELELAEREEIYRILADLSARIGAVAEMLEQNHEILIRLDTIFSRGRYGAAAQGSIPVLGDEPFMHILQGRHPRLDWKLRAKGSSDGVVPLDLKIGGETHTMIITGPNAGGKTVALKTVGTLVLMALAGIPIPAGPDTVLYAPPELFADIGDEQSVVDDLSTYSSHMTNIVSILRNAVPGSLVLLDELGGATNPADGEAIALAILRKLASLKAMTLATSHLDRLKLYAYETPGVMNASMEFDTSLHRPTFRLSTGVPGSSYAFEIAARLNMPPEVLEDAEALAGGERKSMAGLIAELEEHVLQARKEHEAALTEHREAASSREKYEQKLADFNVRKNDIIAGALDESKRIVSGTNKRIESAIRELREKGASREAILEAKTTVRETTADLEKQAVRVKTRKPESDREPIAVLHPGQAVWIPSMGAEGVVEEVLSDGTKARVRAGKGTAALIIDRRNLESSRAVKQEEQTVIISTSTAPVDFLELDVRGKTFDEAQEEIETFLFQLRSSGEHTARIIHGKGTGALRKKISTYLNRHEAVAEYRLGNWNEGSFGVTVVTLKE